jgi:hypothetical protein
MLNRIKIAITALGAIIMVSGYANAGVELGLGAEFAWDNYKRALMTYDTSDAPNTMASIDYSSPRFGGEFQLHMLQKRMVLAFDMDMGIFTHTVYPFVNNSNELTDVKFIKFAMGINLKFHFIQPETKKASPYVFVGLGKVFGKADATLKEGTTEEDAAAFNAQLEMMGKLSSPFYVQFGIGAEFFAADAFSIGADIFGFRMEMASVDVGQIPSGKAEYSGSQKYLNLYMYSSLNINFTFGGRKKAKKEDKKEDESADDGWGTPDSSNDGWGTPAATPVAGSNSWGTPPPPPAP